MTNPYAYYEESPEERQADIGRLRENIIRPVMRLMIFVTVVQAILGVILLAYFTIYLPPCHVLHHQGHMAYFIYGSIFVVPPILTTLVLAIALSKNRFGAVLVTLVLSIFPLLFGFFVLYVNILISVNDMIALDELAVGSTLFVLASAVIVSCVRAIIRYVSLPDVPESDKHEGETKHSSLG